MYKVQIFSISKSKEPWLIQAIEEYTRRLRPILSIHWNISKNEDKLLQALDKEKSYIALDSRGKSVHSEDFSHWLIKTFQHQDSRLNFIIGGAGGLPKEITTKADTLLSLSNLTFTHQMTRVILLEQIYRAF